MERTDNLARYHVIKRFERKKKKKDLKGVLGPEMSKAWGDVIDYIEVQLIYNVVFVSGV